MSKKRSNNTLSLPTPKTPTQKILLQSLQSKPMTIVTGPAGVGKSYVPAIYAAYLLRMGKIKKIVLTRPTVPTGRSIGFFPGDLNEKMEPWTRPILDTISEYLGKGVLESMFKNGNIEIVPFETIRGRSFENAFIILDEAQNCTPEELKAFVTRVGEHSTSLINGDISQSDIKGCSGLQHILNIHKKDKALQRYVALVEFNSDDIVRSGLCQLWVKAYETYGD